jgi:leucyl/phenylalanyl-tRNA---protein transferase
MTIYQLPDEVFFPDPSDAEPDGLLAVGGDLKPERLLTGYANGIFPWYSQDDPILWWSPDPRFVLFPDNFKISHSLRQKIRNNFFEVKVDNSFEEVIRACAIMERKGETGTWITEEMHQAYIDLHRLGFAHSYETYYNGKLVGGLYGVEIGKAFFGESMFHSMTDASKVALYFLVEDAKRKGLLVIDSQVETKHMAVMGAELIPRKDYLKLIQKAVFGDQPVH